MDIFGFFTLLGGLAMFLYGMSTMGDGLVLLSGGKLEKILEKLTGNRLMALLLGTLVTAIIQSSSATTVMVVGFVNSGIMRLSQAVGVIMGANIGTTVTSWILSLAGIESGNVFVKMLKPSSFTPILAIIGIILIMTNKEGTKKRNIGGILMGFAVLMFGMETMSGAVAPLKENEAFTGMLTAFSNPILGLLAGTILTGILQSSSASVGILQAMCISGFVQYSTAIPIIMGQNIGTCVTALISSIGAAKNARRAAFIHLYFNLIGTILFMVTFYSVNHFVQFAFMGQAASAVGIAIIHSMFNIGCAVVLFPFGDLLVKLATVTVRESGEDTRKKEEIPVLAELDERFLDMPAFATQLCKNAVDEMARKAEETIQLAMEVFKGYDEDKIRQVIALEQVGDHFEDVLGSYMVKLAVRDLNKEDSHTLSVLLRGISDIERMSDHAINMTEAAQRMHARGLTLTPQGQQELDALGVAVCDIMRTTIDAFVSGDITKAAQVEPLEEVIDDLVAEMRQRHITRLQNGICSMEAGLLLEDILTDYERVSDHCSNIAAMMVEIKDDVLDMHRYIDVTLREGNMHFRQEVLRLKQIYILP